MNWTTETITTSFPYLLYMPRPARIVESALPQTSAVQTVQAPVGPAAPRAELPTPRTAAELAAVRSVRDELSNQLQSAANRRSSVASQLAKADEAAQPGLQQRLSVLDNRIAQLETDIAATGRQITNSPSALLGTSEQTVTWLGLSQGQTTAVSIVFTIFVLAPIAVAFAKILFNRTRKFQPPAIPAEHINRMERLENAVDTIAVEVERISEGQRFLTQVMTGGSAGALPSAAPIGEPIKLAVGGQPEPARSYPR